MALRPRTWNLEPPVQGWVEWIVPVTVLLADFVAARGLRHSGILAVKMAGVFFLWEILVTLALVWWVTATRIEVSDEGLRWRERGFLSRGVFLPYREIAHVEIAWVPALTLHVHTTDGRILRPGVWSTRMREKLEAIAKAMGERRSGTATGPERAPDEPYRASMPVTSDPYTVAWGAIRRSEARLGWFAAGCAGWEVLAIGIVPLVDPAHVPYAVRFPVLSLPVLLPLAWGVYLAATLRCPHCRGLVMGGRHRITGQPGCPSCGMLYGTPRSAVLDAQKRSGDSR
jgi:hypothetical protein